MSRAFYLLLVFSLLTLTGFARAQPCEAFGEQVLELAGFGAARFGELSYSSQTDSAELSGGVCIVSEAEAAGAPLWTIVAASMTVTGVRQDPSFRLEGATLTLPGWTLYAETLSSTTGGFVLAGLSFRSQDVRGRATEGRYDLETGGMALTNVSATGEGFRVSGAEAALEGERLLFQGARFTTCFCDEGALYVVAAPSASVHLVEEEVLIQNGVLKIGNVDITLAEELELSEASLRELRFPLELAQVEGVGLTLRTVPLPLAEGIGLELGLAALDSHSPRGVLLFSVEQAGLSATVGAAPLGFQADLRREEPLTDALSLAFGIRNRHWDKADYLHEGYLGLEAAAGWQDLLTEGRLEDRLSLSAGLTTAASSQLIADRRVLSSRLVLRTGADYTLSEATLGTFGLDLSSSLSYYPRYERWQYGLELAPSWRGDFGPVSTSLRYERLLTNSASPFSTSLDRLTPKSLLSAQLTVSGEPAAGVQGRFGSAFRYDFLANEATKSAVRTAKLSAGATFEVGEGALRPSLELELAQLLSPADDPDVEAYIAGELAYTSPDVEAGAYLEYNLEPQQTGLDALELYAGAPLTLEALTLHPFLAVDFAAVVTDGGPLELAGHGLELSYRSCCGVFTAGYRLHRDTFNTVFSFALPTGDE